MPDLQLMAPDGTSRVVALQSEPMLVGRSSAAQLSFPDDAGLSRQHLVIEPDGEAGKWQVRDLGSKNGTNVNGAKLIGPAALNSGDRITAGHLILVFDPVRPSTESVIVFDPGETPMDSGATVVTNLKGLLGATGAAATTPAFADRQIAALVRAGNELSGHRPLP